MMNIKTFNLEHLWKSDVSNNHEASWQQINSYTNYLISIKRPKDISKKIIRNTKNNCLRQILAENLLQKADVSYIIKYRNEIDASLAPFWRDIRLYKLLISTRLKYTETNRIIKEHLHNKNFNELDPDFLLNYANILINKSKINEAAICLYLYCLRNNKRENQFSAISNAAKNNAFYNSHILRLLQLPLFPMDKFIIFSFLFGLSKNNPTTIRNSVLHYVYADFLSNWGLGKIKTNEGPEILSNAIKPNTYRKDTIFQLNRIENDISIINTRISGLPIWPIARSILGHKLEQLVLNSCATSTIQPANVHQATSQLYALADIDLLKAKKLGPKNYNDIDIAFYCLENYYTKCSETGLWENIRLDNTYLEASKNYKCIKFHLPFHNLHANSLKHPSLEINIPTHKPKLSKIDELRIISFKLSLKNNYGIPEKYFAPLRNRIIETIYLKKVFTSWLKIVNPKIVCVTHFLSPKVMPLILACDELGIKTAEMQHGIIGSSHWTYTHWHNISEATSVAFPDYMIVWDKETKKNLTNSNNIGNNKLKAILGKKSEPIVLPKSLTNCEHTKALEQKVNEYDRVILLATQATAFLPDYIFNAIEESPKNWLWLIRLHREVSGLADAWSDIKRLKNYNNIDIELATKAPLKVVLPLCDHVVTGFSTLAIDAIPYGIKSILTYEAAEDFFADEIKSGTLVKVFNIEQLLAELNRNTKTKLENKSSRIIKPKTNQQAFAYILSCEQKQPNMNLAYTNITNKKHLSLSLKKLQKLALTPLSKAYCKLNEIMKKFE